MKSLVVLERIPYMCAAYTENVIVTDTTEIAKMMKTASDDRQRLTILNIIPLPSPHDARVLSAALKYTIGNDEEDEETEP
jgi:hypothetical protein